MKHSYISAFILAAFLLLLFVAFWFILPRVPNSVFWPVFALAAVVWFCFEYRNNEGDKKRIIKALKIGLILVAANLLVNYYFGFVKGAYIIGQNSLFFILGNPIELLAASFLGGAAWFLRVPKKFDKIYSALDVLTLAFFGMLAEVMLIGNDLLTYITVDSLNAFLTYALIWTILHFVYYKILK